ncbi:putative polysaccharide biosynthesis protein [Faecalicatena contorta]|uniref:putative polysaccharide biosynthesis protein n=1 Tax=Faecalicatena contorta TaxID=39482 RepID=UPI001F17B306|nr:polysaccharide biosynthesis protein [Faecalicatena contorta]MCF2682835.1 polysaccharide biosynthesis protein [Faecalicatena contorta]
MADQKKKEKNFLVQGSILAIAGVITKIIGVIYRVPLMNIVGDEGMGYYSVAFSIYTVALMLTSYSLPLAVSKLVSARVAKGEYKNAYKVFKGAMTFAILGGGLVSLIIFFGADFIADFVMHLDKSAYALRVLAPCILVVALLGVIRGFFQGNGSMVPTAVSQVVEQIVNAVASVAGAYVLLQAGKELAEKHNDKSYGPAYAAAGGTFGTIAGAFSALVFVALIFFAYQKIFKRKMRRDRTRHKESYQRIYKVLFATIAPVILSATVYNISDFADSALFNTIMAAQGYKKTEYASLLGMFQGQYSTLINVPLSIASALAASLIPSLVATVQTGNRKQVHNKITTVCRFNMIIAIPCAVGFLVLAKPLLDLLFFTQDNTTAALMLQLGALSVVFFCLSTVTNSVLQGLDDMITPVKNAAISLVIHIISLFLMLVVLKWNIYAVVLSKIVFSGAICILNAHALRERIGYVQEKKKTFIIPTIASAIMGVIAIVVHLLFELFAGSYIATILAVIAAVITYAVFIILLGGITEEELLDMPKGAFLVTLCRKLHLIKGEYR